VIVIFDYYIDITTYMIVNDKGSCIIHNRNHRHVNSDGNYIITMISITICIINCYQQQHAYYYYYDHTCHCHNILMPTEAHRGSQRLKEAHRGQQRPTKAHRGPDYSKQLPRGVGALLRWGAVS
jgi:hypothetical protein